MYHLPNTLRGEIALFRQQVEEYQRGAIEPVAFKAIRVPMGIYEQRKDGTYMVRVRCAGGFIMPRQLKGLADAARQYGAGYLHITTRQELQVHHVTLENAYHILNAIYDVGLTARGGGGNTVRNIMASYDSGIAEKEVFDVLPYAVGLTNLLISQADSWQLPRKFKISFSCSEQDTGYALFNDLGFVARVEGGKRGFCVYVGGGLANNPMVGEKLFDFIPEEEVGRVAEAVKKLFSTYGNRRNKHKARLRFLFYKYGKEQVFKFFHEFYQELKKGGQNNYHVPKLRFSPINENLISERADDDRFEEWKEQYVQEQPQKGFHSVMLPFLHGQLYFPVINELAEFLEAFGEDVIRFSMRQNMHLRNIPTAYLGNVFNFLKRKGILEVSPRFVNELVSCTGADTCRLGICLSKGALVAIRERILEAGLPFHKLENLRINISGCPNSCGQQTAADIGFHGMVTRTERMYPSYNVVAGAVIGNGKAELAKSVGRISARDVPDFLVDVLSDFLNKQERYQEFPKYVQAEGRALMERLCKETYRDIPSFSEDESYYRDWGSDEEFSLVGRGLGECSAGLFDMIDVDKKAMKAATEALAEATTNEAISECLYSLIRSASRMLLVTRGAEPKDDNAIFVAFLDKFIGDHLIDKGFEELILLAKEQGNSEKLIPYRERALELSHAVNDLYDSLDDSLQFHIDGKKSVRAEELHEDKQGTVRQKDYRGVACPMNFVKTKMDLATMKKGEVLEILLDDGEPIANVPGSVKEEGHKILKQEQVENHWLVRIEKV